MADAVAEGQEPEELGATITFGRNLSYVPPAREAGTRGHVMPPPHRAGHQLTQDPSRSWEKADAGNGRQWPRQSSENGSPPLRSVPPLDQVQKLQRAQRDRVNAAGAMDALFPELKSGLLMNLTSEPAPGQVVAAYTAARKVSHMDDARLAWFGGMAKRKARRDAIEEARLELIARPGWREAFYGLYHQEKAERVTGILDHEIYYKPSEHSMEKLETYISDASRALGVEVSS